MKSDDSGFRWGPFNIQGPRPWRLQIEQLGGSVYYPYDYHPRRAKISQGPRDADLTKPIIMKGNHFEAFTHARDLANTEWYYWDNCLVPQLMMPSAANPHGEKHWTRLVYRSTAPEAITATEAELEQHLLRVNEQIRRISNGAANSIWDIIAVKPVRVRGTRILVCLSAQLTISKWYNESLADLRNRIESWAEPRGYTVEYREKTARKHRVGTESLEHQLLNNDYRFVICTHSASALEVLATGTPVVALGAEAAHGLNTPWSKMLNDELTTPTADDIQSQITRMLTTVWHKQELLTGDWSLSYNKLSQTPYTKWTLYD